MVGKPMVGKTRGRKTHSRKNPWSEKPIVGKTHGRKTHGWKNQWSEKQRNCLNFLLRNKLHFCSVFLLHEILRTSTEVHDKLEWTVRKCQMIPSNLWKFYLQLTIK